MKKKIYIVILLWIVDCIAAYAQDTLRKAGNLTISGYAEIYYGYDFNRPTNNNRPAFVYSQNRHNEVNLNLGFIKAAYDNGTVRTNLAIMAGTYANANLSAEPGVLKNIFEANAGVKLSKIANFWIDAGIFASHISFESAISKDCWVLTRNISSENTPYYESGARLTYITADGKVTIAGLYLNGWQRITRQDGNSKPAGGLQVQYKPTNSITLNYSNYLGIEGADSIGVRRLYHDFYGIFQLSKIWGVTAGFDYGVQQTFKGSSSHDHVLSPVVIVRCQMAERWAAATRWECYQDKHGILIASANPNGFSTNGYSVNIDYAPVSNAVIRLEGKVYSSKDAVFMRSGLPVQTDPALTASLAVSF